MSTEVRLDDVTYARVKQLAETQKISVEQVISQAIERIAVEPGEATKGNGIIGALADCADLLDEIVEDAYRRRETTPFRLTTE